MRWIRVIGFLLAGIGLSVYWYTKLNMPDQVLFSAMLASGQPVFGRLDIPSRGSFSVFLKFEGRPEELGLKEEDWFQRNIDYPLHVKMTADRKVIVDTNYVSLTRAKYGANVVCYEVATVSIQQPSRIELHVSSGSSSNSIRLTPARIELHRPDLAAQNTVVLSRIGRVFGIALSMVGLVLLAWSYLRSRATR